MRYGALGQSAVATQVEARPSAAPASVKDIPYDYVATFNLTGEFGRRSQDVITVSTEGSFIAVSIGYSFVPPRLPTPTIDASAADLTVNGMKIPVLGPAGLLLAVLKPQNGAPSAQLIQSITQLLAARQAIDFRYSIVDSGTGRELQNHAIHNIAGLGIATGDRPFRPFARPALFLPRSTIRFEVEELSEGPVYAGGTLYIVLHGYKRLGE